jgi:hydrogenase-4 component F
MSGVLLAVALYAVIRWEAVANAAVGTQFTDGLFIALGVLSIAIAAFSLVVQRNYKRLLAYSSIEHTGLMCLGLALGPLGTFAAMLHLLNHTLAKSTLFFLAGRVLQRYRTTEIARVSGLLATMPWTGGLFATAMLAAMGLPPFGLFISEFALFRAGFAAGRPWLMGLVLALLVVAFVSMIGHLNRMLYGLPAAGTAVGEGSPWPLIPLGGCVAALVVLGFALPQPLRTLLEQIVEIAGR